MWTGLAWLVGLAVVVVWGVAVFRVQLGGVMPLLRGVVGIQLGLALVGILTAGTPAAGWAAALSIVPSVLFLAIGRIAPQRSGIQASVGEASPGGVALGPDGSPFDLDVLRGRPHLIKFYRGHW